MNICWEQLIEVESIQLYGEVVAFSARLGEEVRVEVDTTVKCRF